LGFNLQGRLNGAAFRTRLTLLELLNYLGNRKAARIPKDTAGLYGLFNCAPICCDLPYQYVDEYFNKLGETSFRPIRNKVRGMIIESRLI
jgi:hypothetical protein